MRLGSVNEGVSMKLVDVLSGYTAMMKLEIPIKVKRIFSTQLNTHTHKVVQLISDLKRIVLEVGKQVPYQARKPVCV